MKYLKSWETEEKKPVIEFKEAVQSKELHLIR